MTKVCSQCGIEKEFRLFYPSKTCVGGVRPDCRTYNKKSRGVRHQKAKIYNPERRKSVVLKNKYNITLEDFNRMLSSQDGKCKICGSSDPGPKRTFSVDHCHKTSKVRGLLCYLCNVGLGSFRDNQNYLNSAVKYLEETQ
jgi:hypothetical protein